MDWRERCEEVGLVEGFVCVIFRSWFGGLGVGVIYGKFCLVVFWVVWKVCDDCRLLGWLYV